MSFKDIFNIFSAGAKQKNTSINPAINTGCDQFEINNWIISEFIINRLVPLIGVHPFPLNELMLMVAAVCRTNPSHIMEWGTNIGISARIFYETCNAFSLDCEIHSVDLPDDILHAEHPGRDRGRLVHGVSGVYLHQGDGLELSVRILESAGEQIRPLFFLDGDHSYDSVYRELSYIIQQVHFAGILIHDTFFQSSASGYNIGPYLAIQDVLNEVKPKVCILSQNLGLPGMTLILPGRLGD